MPDLSFGIQGVEVAKFAAAPLLNFKLRMTEKGLARIHAVALRCQLRIEPAKRSYRPGERERLTDLFGEPSRWGETLKSFLWTHASTVAPPFEGTTIIDLPVPCTFDFNVAASKYFYALEADDVPLFLLFSGTIFYEGPAGGLQVAQIPWDCEARFRLPVQVWRDMMEHYYPNSAWLRLEKDAFDRLYQFKRQHGLPTWEAAIEKLLDEKNQPEALPNNTARKYGADEVPI